MRRADRLKGFRQKGFSLIELMVAVVIGMVAVYATYRIYQNVEGNYRSTDTANEAQVTGLYAMLTVSKELSNAGAGFMNNTAMGGTGSTALQILKNCVDLTAFFPPTPSTPAGGAASRFLPLYPLPVAIIPDTNPVLTASNPSPDDVYVFYGTESMTDLPIAASVSGSALSLKVPPLLVEGGGLKAHGLAPQSVLVTTSGGSSCSALVIQGNPTDNGGGGVNVTIDPRQLTDGVGAAVVDLGNVVRRRFFVDRTDSGGGANPMNLGTLKMEIWQVDTSSAVGPNSWKVTSTVPIAANVVAFNAQYGVASVSGGPIDRWVPSIKAPLNQIINASPTIQAQNIKAIRFGLIVSTAEPDTSLGDPSLMNPPTNSQPASYTETLFADCPNGATCDPPQTVTLQTWQSGQRYGWRYRKYETTVPLQNTIWNPT
ncbi:MAG: prepilin-type N-terminal cleavage/methylation domain-containing protein [Betaproteobacteria bacterium]|nr:prepilin-type N-terminal cleavage/methylation domain-containing protein [Betaproteobacteria bacterium]